MVNIKTLVELFDNCQLENIIASLKFKPDRIVYIGFEKVMTLNKMNAVSDFFKGKLENCQIEFEVVKKNDIDLIVEKLEQIYNKYENCMFDMTGGKETLLTALGIFMADKKVPVFQFDVEEEKFINIKNCENFCLSDDFKITIPKALELNGCSLLTSEEGDYKWHFSDEFIKDIEKMWDISSDDPGAWNAQSNGFERIEKLRKPQKGLSVYLNLNNIKKKVYINMDVITPLVDNGLITDFIHNDKILSFNYKNEQVKQTLIKAGNILELYGYILIDEIKKENQEDFDDVDLSVYIDWDGIIHPEYSKVKDTKNEVDIMVINKLIPVFISCKNGEVKKEALYELDTVASRFGGKYAKKILFATYISHDFTSYDYIINRANDMNIKVIQNMHKKSKAKIKSEIIKILHYPSEYSVGDTPYSFLKEVEK